MRRISQISPVAVALGFALVVSACSNEADAPVTDDNESAKGEILGGTISDDMIPLESVTSRSPQLADEPEPVSIPSANAPAESAPDDPPPGQSVADQQPAAVPPSAPAPAPQPPAAPEEQL